MCELLAYTNIYIVYTCIYIYFLQKLFECTVGMDLRKVHKQGRAAKLARRLPYYRNTVEKKRHEDYPAFVRLDYTQQMHHTQQMHGKPGGKEKGLKLQKL